MDEYRSMVRAALRRLDAGTADLVVEIAELPDLVRGYEDVKLRNVAHFRARAAELHDQLALRGRAVHADGDA